MLLERRGRGVAPTDAGELLSVYLRRQESQKQHLLAQMDAIRKVERGHIDIVAGEGYIDWLMRHSLQAFMRSHPAITVSLEVGSSDEIVRRVIDERAHIGLLFQRPGTSGCARTIRIRSRSRRWCWRAIRWRAWAARSSWPTCCPTRGPPCSAASACGSTSRQPRSAKACGCRPC
jgi:DNA-binding transcriptional LysR family regulator